MGRSACQRRVARHPTKDLEQEVEAKRPTKVDLVSKNQIRRLRGLCKVCDLEELGWVTAHLIATPEARRLSRRSVTATQVSAAQPGTRVLCGSAERRAGGSNTARLAQRVSSRHR
jgi:hypothetical protein